MKQKLIKILAITLLLLGKTQQGMASGIPLEELGVYQDPETKKYVLQHIDHYPTKEEMRIAEGLYASARAQLKKHGIPGLESKPDIRRATVLALAEAARYGHPEALKWLSDSLSTDWSGEEKYEDEAARAVATSPVKSLWRRAEDYQRISLPIPDRVVSTMKGVKIPKEILEVRRKAEEEREAAEVAPLSAVVLDGLHEESKEDEREPLLRRRPTAGLHEDDDHTG